MLLEMQHNAVKPKFSGFLIYQIKTINSIKFGEYRTSLKYRKVDREETLIYLRFNCRTNKS